MNKYLFFFAMLCISVSAQAQLDSLTKEEKRLLDSMFKNDEVIKMLKGKDKNYLDISIQLGNGLFSTQNNAANATGVNKQLVYTPTVTYRMKSGLSFGVAFFITGDSSKRPALYQTGITAGYDYYGDKINAGLSYTRYLSDQDKYNGKSYYQNDFFGYAKLAKGLLQPGIMLGYASGDYKETAFVNFKRKVHLPNPPPNGRDTIIIVTGRDSTDNKTSYFSATGTVGHDYVFYKVLGKNDELNFTPTLLVNFGSDKLTQTHTNKMFNRPALSSRKKSEFSNGFQIQSVAASVDLTYMIKGFFIEPNLYVDYYLPETTEKRLSAIFSISCGVTL